MVARTTRSLHVLDTLALAMRVLAVGSEVLHGEDGTSNYKSTATPQGRNTNSRQIRASEAAAEHEAEDTGARNNAAQIVLKGQL